MSKYIATRAIRGANSLVTEAELMLNRALNDKGAEYAGFFSQHCLLSSHHPGHDRQAGRETGRAEAQS